MQTILALAIFTGPVSAGTSEFKKLAAREPILALEKTRDAILAVGARGHILRSTDSGAQWRQIESPARLILTSLCQTPNGRLFVTGYEATLLESSDGGESFSLRHRLEDEDLPLFACHFTNENEGIAVGAYGLVLQTDDGGKTWIDSIIDDEEPHVYGLFSPDDQAFLLAVTEFGLILKKDRTEESWRRVYEEYGGSLFGIDQGPDEVFMAYGLNGFALRSADGDTWEDFILPESSSLFNARVVQDVIWMAGANGLLLSVGKDAIDPVRLSDRLGINAMLSLTDAEPVFLLGTSKGLYHLDLSDHDDPALTPLQVSP